MDASDETLIYLDHFFARRRGNRSLQTHVVDFEQAYEDAVSHCALELNHIGLTHLFFKLSGLSEQHKDNFKLVIQGDLSKYTDLKKFVLRFAKQPDAAKQVYQTDSHEFGGPPPTSWDENKWYDAYDSIQDYWDACYYDEASSDWQADWENDWSEYSWDDSAFYWGERPWDEESSWSQDDWQSAGWDYEDYASESAAGAFVFRPLSMASIAICARRARAKAREAPVRRHPKAASQAHHASYAVRLSILPTIVPLVTNLKRKARKASAANAKARGKASLESIPKAEVRRASEKISPRKAVERF